MGWQCKNDKPDGIEIPSPPSENIIAQNTIDFAEGNFQGILAKGGPVGAFLWGHLHGIHNDRYGKTKYNITMAVYDDTNFPYMIADYLSTEVEGVVDKSERHRHCFSVFTAKEEFIEFLKAAIENNIPLRVEISGDRDRNNWKWLTEEAKSLFNQYISNEITSLDLLRKLTNGEKPPFLR